MTRRVLGGVTRRKGGGNLTDEVPRRSRGERPGIRSAIRPKPKCGVRRRRARGVPWLSLLGDSSVSGGGRQVWRPRGHTGDRGVDEPHGTGPVRPRVPTTSGPPRLFREGHGKAKNRRKVMGAPDPQVVWSRRITGMLQVLPHKHRVHSLTGRITLDSASQRLQGGQAQPRGGRTRQAVHHEVRSQSGGEPLGADARAEVGGLSTDPTAGGCISPRAQGASGLWASPPCGVVWHRK